MIKIVFLAPVASRFPNGTNTAAEILGCSFVDNHKAMIPKPPHGIVEKTQAFDTFAREMRYKMTMHMQEYGWNRFDLVIPRGYASYHGAESQLVYNRGFLSFKARQACSRSLSLSV